MSRARTVTLKDVAAVSGVSVATASRVLNGQGRVSVETRKRILEAAERLEFRPNALAQFFATGKSHTVAVLAQKAAGTFSMPVIQGVLSRLSKDDVAAVVYDAIEDDVSGRPENIRKLRARQIDGIIVVGDGNDRVFPSISQSVSAPVVYAYGASDHADDLAFMPDDLMAGRVAAERVIAAGRTRVAIVTGPEYSGAVQRRNEGIVGVLGAAGARIVGEPMYGGWTREHGSRAIARLLAGADFDAVICGNDFIAMSVISGLREAGRRVPEDVAVIGHDHWDQYIGDAANITSVNPELHLLGQRAGDALVHLAYGDSTATGVVELPCSLVEGGTA